MNSSHPSETNRCVITGSIEPHSTTAAKLLPFEPLCKNLPSIQWLTLHVAECASITAAPTSNCFCRPRHPIAGHVDPAAPVKALSASAPMKRGTARCIVGLHGSRPRPSCSTVSARTLALAAQVVGGYRHAWEQAAVLSLVARVAGNVGKPHEVVDSVSAGCSAMATLTT